MLIAGIDYSMTCPCVCIHDMTLPFTFENCQFYYVTNIQRLDGVQTKNIHGSYLDKKQYKDDIERFVEIAKLIVRPMISERGAPVQIAGLEGYSMRSRGMVFNIGENTGILKYSMLSRNIPYEIYSPQTIKSFTVKDSSLDTSSWKKNKIDKDQMYEMFFHETGSPLKEILSPKKKNIDSPITDIVDSYYITKKLRKDIESGNIKIPKVESQ